MHQDRLSYLLKQYLANSITKEELDELFLHLDDEASSTALQTRLETLIEGSPEATDYREKDWTALYQTIMERGGPTAGHVRRLSRRWIAAAVIFLLLAGGIVWYKGNTERHTIAVAPLAHDAAPGSNKAILTLADGTRIDLDSARNGLVGRQGNQELIKNNNAQLVYESGKGGSPGEEKIQYNLLTTPRGGQYKLQLPDGSQVWLNAATSLRYPTSFTGADRVVELKGEAYFEIAANSAKPFRVKVIRGESGGGQHESDPLLVEVLGTHFNIMDYDDEPAVNTTLLEGLVRVRKGGRNVLVRPGEQARLNKRDELQVTAADTEEAIAWKDGMFNFKNAGIEQVMRQLARWYDVEVVYVNGVPGDRFQGEMYRNVNASKILKVLEASGVHFTVEGKKINLFMDKAP